MRASQLNRVNSTPADVHLLEAPHAVQDVELLPAFREVDFAVNQVWVAKVYKGQVLKNETPGREREGCDHPKVIQKQTVAFEKTKTA